MRQSTVHLNRVKGMLLCDNCLQALWMTGQRVEGCAIKHCGKPVPEVEAVQFWTDAWLREAATKGY